MTAPRVVVLDYGSGNLRSAVRAVERAGASVELTSDFDAALDADGLLVPGVGAYAACMAGLRAVKGDRIIGRGRDWLLQTADTHHAGRHAESHESGGSAILTGGLNALGDARLQVHISARTGERIGALHGLQQFLRVRVVLDGDDGHLDDGEAAIGAPPKMAVSRILESPTKARSSWKARPRA